MHAAKALKCNPFKYIGTMLKCVIYDKEWYMYMNVYIYMPRNIITSYKWGIYRRRHPGPLLLTWINFNPGMAKQS